MVRFDLRSPHGSTWPINIVQVSEHESSCKGIQSEEEIIQEMISRGDFFLCDNNCGFTEIFSVVKEHEKQCKFGRVCTPCEEESEEGFECDHGCGFTGTFAAVSEHEKTCAGLQIT